jgi:formate dehydrogenase major subunit
MRSCCACVEACPTGALMEKSVITAGLPQQAVATTCAYCGVGCALVAEVTDGVVSRMVPNRNGRANQGHACVKGRFAYGYATHQDRVTKPMIRKSITEEWREVSWDEAIQYAASEFKRIQAKHGRDSIGGITSSAAPTRKPSWCRSWCARVRYPTTSRLPDARVCHSPTGYGLKHTLGESAGTQEFVLGAACRTSSWSLARAHRSTSGVCFADEAAPARGCEADCRGSREIPLVRSSHVERDYHLR